VSSSYLNHLLHFTTLYRHVGGACTFYCSVENLSCVSTLPARTKASNAYMTACRPLYTRLHCLDYKSTGLRPKILPPQSRDNKATGIWPDNSDVTLHSYRLQCTWQFLKLHGCASRCTAAAAASQTEYKCYAVTSSGRIPNCMHAAAVALLQWQVIKLLH
jgi:hypothetical protein